MNTALVDRASGQRAHQDERAQDLNFYYGKFQALKNINLQVPEKKVTAFIGPSGCGKSTLLRVFNRMFELYPEQRAEGEVSVDGENILTTQGRRRADPRQDRHDLPEADAVSDVDLRQHCLRREACSRACRSPRWTIVSSGRCARRPCGTRSRTNCPRPARAFRAASSSGCASRAASRSSPEIILFDEPCSALDPISTAKIEELIDELKTDYTVAIVTHNMQQAARVSDYTAYMYLGRSDRVWRHRPDLHQAQAQGNRGLHHRPFRLKRQARASRTENNGNRRSLDEEVRRGARGDALARAADGRARRVPGAHRA